LSLLVPSLGLKSLSDSGQKILASSDFKFTSLDGYDQGIIFSILGYVLIIFICILGSNLHLLVTYFTQKSIKKNETQLRAS
jgi:Na+/proline symporter